MSPADSHRVHDQRSREGSEGQRESGTENNLVRLIKPVIVADDPPGLLDESIVSSQFYNRFAYSLLAQGAATVKLTIGVTSANPGEGKTLVASNLAVSLAVANRRDTVLVDLSILRPRLHSVFGTPLGPGLMEAIAGGSIKVWKTSIDHLHVLPAGIAGNLDSMGQKSVPSELSGLYNNELPALGIEKVVVFRDIVYSLRENYEFVIIDMPVLTEPRVPVILTHQMDGLLVVVDATRTKHRDVEKMFRQVNTNQVLGFVFNRTSDEDIE
jgi:Mrp family chromosome partitioning ATPase